MINPEPGTLVAGNPLLALGAYGQTPGETIEQSDLDSIVDDAIAYWTQRGFSYEALAAVDIEVTDLKNNALGIQSGNTIQIDADAAGHGWYVDSNVNTNEPFDGMDLYTTMAHELGHILGHQDLYGKADAGNLMYGYLENGERRIDSHTNSLDNYFGESKEDVDAWFGWN